MSTSGRGGISDEMVLGTILSSGVGMLLTRCTCIWSVPVKGLPPEIPEVLETRVLGIDHLVGTLGSRAGTSWKVLDPSTLLPVGVHWRCVAVPAPIVPMLWLMALVFIYLEEGMRGISDLLLAGARDGGLEASRDGSVFGKQSRSEEHT